MTPEAANPAPTVDAALYEKLESAVAEGRNIVGNARSRVTRLVAAGPQPSTPEWVQFLGALSENLSAYDQLLNEAGRGLPVGDPAFPTIEALQSMLAGMREIAGLSNIPAGSAMEARFAQTTRHLDSAWGALQKTQ